MAITGQQQSHAPGIWKQQNKNHKTGRHRSKRQIDVEKKGRVDIKTISKHHKKVVHKIDRRNRAKQIRSQKREEVFNQKRSIGVGHTPPHLTVLVPLHHNVDISLLSQSMKGCGSSDGSVVSEAPQTTAGFTLNIPRLKHRFQIIQPGSASYADVLDCVQVSDTVVFLVSCDEDEPIDEHGYKILTCLLAQGIPSMIFCLQGLKDIAIKRRNPIKKEVVKKLEHYVSNIKFHVVDTEQETFSLLRSVAEIKRKKIGVRERRPYMLVEKVNYVGDEDKDAGTLEVSGHVRGFALNVNRLVHVVGWGDFQIKQIDEVAEHCPWNARKTKQANEDGMEVQKVTIGGKSFLSWEKTGESVTCDPSQQEDLIAEAEVDPMEGEQTWPTQEEIEEAEKECKITKLVKKVPTGTSDYQAAWILDDGEEWEEQEFSDEDVMEEEGDGLKYDDLQPREEEDSQIDEDSVIMSGSCMDDTESQSGAELPDDPNQLALFREARSHEMFPDEVDTPDDVAARVRFQRYRGLQSFRTSPWDPKENLPRDYAKIFQFQTFERTKKRIRSLEPDLASSVQPGSYVTLHLANVPKAFIAHHSPSSSLTLFGLFPHEQKMSVLHFALKQVGEETVRNKAELLLHVGFRRFRSKVVFSEHTLGSKHKMERFFPKQGVVIATAYAPVTFPPANVIVFKESKGDSKLIATGSLYKVDPDRIIVKRVVLSGHPFRINKRAATIRYMFFNRDDVVWFKPVELRTKYGRRGHIREPIGTHGHMKCLFNAQLTSQDTVLMTLYKRVYPKWSFAPITPLNREAPSCSSSQGSCAEEMFDEEFFE